MGSGSVTLKQKKRVKHAKNKYLKPGALAQIRYSRSSSRDIGKKRILLNVKDELEISPQVEGVLESTPILSPARLNFEPFGGIKGQILPKTPRTPDAAQFEGDSRLESLPLDLLIKIMCCLHHDQLKAVFHVSRRIRKAVELARQYHFNYTTPDRSRQELLLNKTPLPTEHWPFMSRIDGKDVRVSTPRTPKAPKLAKHASRLARLKLLDVKPITAVLFQESSLPSKRLRRSVPPGLPRPVSKAAPSPRVLRYEEELCEAVAQNKLL
ncbi:F-box protein At4g35930-like isoform X1 [Phragmites australis]|uniref:F-box protein At4g35930-like isoform X1 n=1 Tax=Phragmites australis TaxID=29695 RepID=UPI002D77606A|nr:F-box protein At4g35930-like isoform X1 [Phragmites australis]XP_062204885.1 F-box protein At4g35930-like isoform X1 [Phragmites australis]